MGYIFFFVYLSTALAHTLTADVPFALWSQEKYISGKNQGISSSLSISAAEQILHSLLDTRQSTPEIILIFTEPKVRSDHLSIYKSSFPNLKNYIQTSTSSLYAPFLDLAFSFDTSVVNFADQCNGKVIYVGKGSTLLQDLKIRVPGTIVSTLSALKDVIISSKLSSNGKTDLIVVHLYSSNSDLPSKYKESDNTIKSVLDIISTFTTKYVAVYTGLEYDKPIYSTKFAQTSFETKKRSVFSVFQFANSTDNNTNTTGNGTIPVFREYFGGWFWELFLVSIVLIPLLLIGVCAIDGIQTPLFEKTAKKK